MTCFGFKHRITTGLLGVLACTLVSSPLHAAGVLFTFAEVGSDVVATTSGSIASGWNATGSSPTTATQALLASTAIRHQKTGVASFEGNWTYNPLGGDFIYEVGVATGDAFGYSGNTTFYAPAGTAVGDAFTPNTTMIWADETFASLGLDTRLSSEPIVLFTLDNESTISAVLGNASAVPGAGLAGLATLGLAGVSRGRRR